MRFLVDVLEMGSLDTGGKLLSTDINREAHCLRKKRGGRTRYASLTSSLFESLKQGYDNDCCVYISSLNTLVMNK